MCLIQFLIADDPLASSSTQAMLGVYTHIHTHELSMRHINRTYASCVYTGAQECIYMCPHALLLYI